MLKVKAKVLIKANLQNYFVKHHKLIVIALAYHIEIMNKFHSFFNFILNIFFNRGVETCDKYIKI